jgi:uncharacterized protein (TIGR03083 family)
MSIRSPVPSTSWRWSEVQLDPHYGADPIIVLDGDPLAIVAPTIRQRRRLAATVAEFTDEQWAHPSRCDGWSARDVIVHLDGTNFFWTLSIAAGLRSEPTRYLATFDPVTSPARSVAQSVGLSFAEVRDRFVESTNTLVRQLEALDAESCALLAEAPPGHVPISSVLHHALWDAWVHERDILLPAGREPDREADEVGACLRWSAALGPALALSRGEARTGRLGIEATNPEVSVLVEIDGRVSVTEGSGDADLVIRGDAVELVDALSIRRPLDHDLPVADAWMLEGLAVTFESQ